MLLCCVGGAIYAVVRWRVKHAETEMRAVLNERTRIAREIHDTLAQGFAGISVQLELVSRLLTQAPAKAQGHLDQARILARTCLEDARRTIWDLRSQNGEPEDLPARLSRLTREATRSSGIEVQFQVRGTYRRLPQRVENEIGRIAQEAITNAVRHSGARGIAANLIFDGDRVRLNVSDDGCGMKETVSADGHYGLTGMRERAQSIGAALSIVSREGEGTSVELETPIR
jgi:signal transduction histidine kinase